MTLLKLDMSLFIPTPTQYFLVVAVLKDAINFSTSNVSVVQCHLYENTYVSSPLLNRESTGQLCGP